MTKHLGASPQARARSFNPARWVDDALRGGLTFMFDRDGRLMLWRPLRDVDPGPEETWNQLCVGFDRFRRRITAELRRRQPVNGRVIMGTPALDGAGQPLHGVTAEVLEAAWRRDVDGH